MSSNRHVLVAVSFDDASVAAMQRALFLARSFRVELRLLHVHGGSQRDGPTVRTVLSWAGASGVVADADSVELRSGDAAREIARIAEVTRPGLVVLGGRTSRDVPGHVVRHVTCHSPVPVPPCVRVVVASQRSADRKRGAKPTGARIERLRGNIL